MSVSVRERACVRARERARACVSERARACESVRERACNFENKTSWIVLNLLKTDNHISGALRKERVIYVSLRFEMMKADTNLAVALVARR